MNNNVTKVINNCKQNEHGEVYLSLKPRIDDLSMTDAHLYSAGGQMCYFNMPAGNGFKIWDKEYEKYSYGELEFIEEKGFKYLFANWNNMIKTCYNRALDEENFKKGKVSGKKPVNHYERMCENRIAAYNSTLDDDSLAVIDMEYSVGKRKADLICAAVENGRIIFYITEYKSTNNGFGAGLRKHYDDMARYCKDTKIKDHLIRTLQERVKYGLIDCSSEVTNIVSDLKANDIEVKLLFLFSDAMDFKSSKMNAVPVMYLCTEKIEKGCLKKALLRDFEHNGKFELHR